MVPHIEGLVVRGSVYTAIFLLTNIATGPGMLIMAFALKEAGLGMGILLTIFTFMIAVFTMKLIIHLGNMTNSHFYPTIMSKAFGQAGYISGAIFVIVFSYLVSVEQLLVLGENGSAMVKSIAHDSNSEKFYTGRPFITAIVMLAVITPLSLLRDITVLASWSVVALITMIMVIIFSAIRFDLLNLGDTADSYVFARGGRGIPNAISIFNGLAVWHQTGLLFYNSMKAKTEAKWSYVMNVTGIIVGALHLVIGILGYATFTEDTRPDLVDNYCLDDVLFSIARGFLMISLALTMPPLIFVIREVIEVSMFPKDQPAPTPRHVFITLFILVAVYALGILIPCTDFVGGLNGDIAGTAIAIILPVGAFLKLQNKRVLSWSNVGMLGLLTYGIVTSLGGIVLDIWKLVDGIHCGNVDTPFYCLDNVTISNNTTLSP